MADDIRVGALIKIDGVERVRQDAKNAGEAIDSMKQKVDRSSRSRGDTRSGGFRARNATFAFQQLAFGAEDFFSVLGTQGLAGGLRAAGNNVSQFASLLGPVTGALAGFGVALGSVAVQYGLLSNMDSKLISNADAAKQYNDALKGLLKTVNKDLAKVKTNAGDSVGLLVDGSLMSIENAERRLAALEKSATSLQVKLRKELQQAQQEYERLRQSQTFSMIGGGEPEEMSVVAAEIARLKKELKDVETRELGLGDTESQAKARREAAEQLSQLRTEIDNLRTDAIKNMADSLKDMRQEAIDATDPVGKLSREYEAIKKQIDELGLGATDKESAMRILNDAFGLRASNMIKNQKFKNTPVTDLPSGLNMRNAQGADAAIRAALGRTRTVDSIDEKQLAEQEKINEQLRDFITKIDRNAPPVVQGVGAL